MAEILLMRIKLLVESTVFEEHEPAVRHTLPIGGLI